MGANDDDDRATELPTTNLDVPVAATPRSKIPSAVYVIVWISLSSAVILFNKWILDPKTTNFRFPIFLTTWHLLFSSIATQILARTSTLLDGRKTVKMTGKVYLRAIVPIGLFFSLSLICSNKAYLYLSVSFIQMLKATTPVAVLLTSWGLAVERPNLKTLRNVSFIVIGVMIASYGEILFVPTGVVYQVFGIAFEAVRLVMVERLLSSAEYKMDPLVSLYYFAPVCAFMNFLMFLIFESSTLAMSDLARVGLIMFFFNALVAFCLNVSVVFLIGKTSSLVLTLCGVLKDILLVCASVLIWGTPVTAIQLVGYSIALSGLVYFKLGGEKIREQFAQLRGMSSRSSTSRKIFAGVGIAFVLLMVGRLYSGASGSTSEVDMIGADKTVHGSMPAYTDNKGSSTAPTPKNKFDIVISMYKEDQTKMAEQLRELKGLTSLKGLDPKVIIYVKDQGADVESIKRTVGADVVKIIPNRGREGGTYLHHIVNEWDNFAAHTMFLQGDMHKFQKLKDRISDYFVPKTGVLSLGFGQSTCECNNCKDSWGGEDTWFRVPEVWSAVHGELCPNSGILISYGGQMIVSASRMRSSRKQVYEHIKGILESDEDHWIHADSKADSFVDKPDNPFFGHTLERSWMTLFHCSDPKLAVTCPSLDTRRGENDSDGTCQCLD